MATPLTSLLNYLKISEEQFTPTEDKYFARLKELLIFRGAITSPQEVDRSNFTDFVKEFQRSKMNDSNPDGIPGENTLWELQAPWTENQHLKLVSKGIPYDPRKGSEPGFTLRSDILPIYQELYAAIKQAGGVITSSGSIRDLNAEVTPGRSSTSMHYTGIALDLFIASGMAKPDTDDYIIERSGTTHWNVWCRVAAPAGETRTLNAVVYKQKPTRIEIETIEARVIDFTATAGQYGFASIGNRDCFPGTYTCAEWWHFQCEKVLVPYLSQFGAELLTVYREDVLSAQAPLWNARKKIFKKDWK